jgi:hypothetical protein
MFRSRQRIIIAISWKTMFVLINDVYPCQKFSTADAARLKPPFLRITHVHKYIVRRIVIFKIELLFSQKSKGSNS